MTTDEAIEALTQVLNRQLKAIGVEALQRPKAALLTTPETLARTVVEWCESLGMSFADAAVFD